LSSWAISVSVVSLCIKRFTHAAKEFFTFVTYETTLPFQLAHQAGCIREVAEGNYIVKEWVYK
jgi:hypothetical protein